jgi:hypothetical protein
MTKNKFDSEQFFDGYWTVIRILVKTNTGWEALPGYEEKSLVWDFLGNIMLTEQLGEEELTSEYAWYPERKELLIARQDAEEGSLYSLLNSRSRVEQISDTECLLFGLKDVVKEPEDFRLKIQIRRM